MTEEKVAELEADWRKKERQAEEQLQMMGHAHSRIGAQHLAGFASAGVPEAEKLYLVARAQLEREKRADADAATAGMVTANQRMADASQAAARASADAARWAKWAAVFTAVAAALTAIGTVVQLVHGR
jgi:hypothetical protein